MACTGGDVAWGYRDDHEVAQSVLPNNRLQRTVRCAGRAERECQAPARFAGVARPSRRTGFPGLAMHNDAPHHRYYQAMEGHWRGKVRFEITDPKRLRASILRVMDRWSVWAMALISRHASTLVLSTSLDYASRGHRNEVLHTTRTSSLGVTLFRSREVILLEDDGRSFRMTGSQAFFPRLWKTTEWTAHGAVAPDHDGAVYHIPFFGETIEQHTRRTPQGLEVIQTTPFSRASILLRLQRPLRAEPGTAADGEGNSAFPDS